MSRERKHAIRSEKVAVVTELTEKLRKAKIVLLADYQGAVGGDGLPVKAIKELRQKLREHQAELKVAKNTLAQKAMMEAGGFDPLYPYMNGATSLALGYDDPVAPAKALLEFAKAHKTPKNEGGLPSVKVGFLEGKLLSLQAVQALAALPGKTMLLAMLLGTIQSPATQFIRMTQAPVQQFLSILSQLGKQREGAPA